LFEANAAKVVIAKSFSEEKFKKVYLSGGAVDIASGSGTRRPGFEYCQGISFLGKHSSAVVYKMT
jgi:hypothetical protein